MDSNFLFKLWLCIVLTIAAHMLNGQKLVGNVIMATEESDGTGEAVAISDELDRIIVGSDLADVDGKENVGITRVYELNSNGIWVQLGQDITGIFKDDELGNSVCISSDGKRIAIGTARGARVYDLVDSNWEQIGSLLKITSTSNNNKINEIRLSDDGNSVVIGGNISGVDVAAFELVGNEWVQKGNILPEEIDDDFALSANGNRIAAISSNNSNFNWEIRVYEIQNDKWELIGNKINPPVGFWFAQGLDISSEGNRVVVALEDPDGSEEGSVASYDLVNGQWVLNPSRPFMEVFTRWGTTLRVSDDGNTFVFGSTYDYSVIDETKVLVYTYMDEGWQLLGEEIQGAAHDESARGHVDITGDGNRIIMGGILNDDGEPYGFAKVYDYSSLVSVENQQKIVELNLYPNPSPDQINISIREHVDSAFIQLFNVQGQLLQEMEMIGTDQKINLPELSGLYFLKLISPKGLSSVYKIIKS